MSNIFYKQSECHFPPRQKKASVCLWRTPEKTFTIHTLISPSGEEISLKEKVNKTIGEHFSKIFKNMPLPDNTFETDFLDWVKDCCKNKEAYC